MPNIPRGANPLENRVVEYHQGPEGLDMAWFNETKMLSNSLDKLDKSIQGYMIILLTSSNTF